MTTVAISGGFDPIHKGHVRLIQEASKLGELHIYLNSDQWLMRKKGFVFMPWEHRAEILEAINGVHKVIPVIDLGDTVCETLRMYRPDIFCNGGDRDSDTTPEVMLCEQLGIQMRFGVGGNKASSSSELVRAVQ